MRTSERGPRAAGASRRGAPAHARRLPVAVIVTAMVVSGTGLLLVLNTASAANEVSRHDLAAREAALAARVQELRDQVAASAAPGSLAVAAVELGMVPAGNPAFLIVAANGTVRVRGKAQAASAAPVALPTVKATHVRHQPRPAHPSPAKRSSTRSPAASTGARHATAAHRSTTAGHPGANPRRGATATPSPTPTRPRPTPTPVVTLPGGPR